MTITFTDKDGSTKLELLQTGVPEEERERIKMLYENGGYVFTKLTPKAPEPEKSRALHHVPTPSF